MYAQSVLKYETSPLDEFANFRLTQHNQTSGKNTGMTSAYDKSIYYHVVRVLNRNTVMIFVISDKEIVGTARLAVIVPISVFGSVLIKASNSFLLFKHTFRYFI